jgi:hypothetical protein
MYEGLAIGGPRDGVKLTAQPDWDGRIAFYDRTPFHTPVQRHHPGRYKWDTALNTWVWYPHNPA